MLIVVQCAVLGMVGGYLVRRCVLAGRRNGTGWASIVARLESDWDARVFCQVEEECSPAGNPLRRGLGLLRARGLWAMYRNAGVLMELADYAARNGAVEDRDVVEALRADAAQIRLNLLASVGAFSIYAAQEQLEQYALRAEQGYISLAICATELIAAQAPELVPAMVAVS